ncbi:hypothetical protein [Larkinella punicea]|uniref:hypothetical protein n=1 Tax=Larkinella punicea TaxID=2315727 RepID=UPI001058BD35|nr:hypothetical protein [Larkinella punicea]
MLSQIKFVANRPILFTRGIGSHWEYTSFNSELRYQNGSNGKFTGKQKISEYSDYGFQIFSESFQRPIFRFDADGVVHENRNETLPILQRRVFTPHFHQYDEEGVEFAFRTLEIDENVARIQSDLDFGFACFCREAKILMDSGGRPALSFQASLFIDAEHLDLHKGIDFE